MLPILPPVVKRFLDITSPSGPKEVAEKVCFTASPPRHRRGGILFETYLICLSVLP